MLINRAVLGLAKIASTKTSRYTLNGFAVEKDCAVATDGHILVHVANPSIDAVDDSFPVIEGVTPRRVNGTAVLVHRDAALAALKALPKKPTIPALGMAMLSDGDKLVVTDLEKPQQFGHALPGQFPNWRAVMPANDKPAQTVIKFDARRMKQLCDYFIAHGNKRLPSVVLTVYDAQSAMKLEGATADGQAVTALLMPVTLD